MRLGLGNSLVLPRGGGLLPHQIPSEQAKLLLHFDGDFSDSSIHNRTPTISGGAPLAAIDASEKVFGSGSMVKADRNPSGVVFPASTDFNMADSVPWQLSARLYRTAFGNEAEIFTTVPDWFQNGLMIRHYRFANKFEMASNGSIKATWDYTLALNTWIAFRCNHDGAGNYRVYVNGTSLGVRGFSFTDNPTEELRIGHKEFTSSGWAGNIDELLWQKHPDLEVTTDATYEVETEPFVIV